MTALFALCSAALAGGADFLGGLVSRRVPSSVVAFSAQALGLAIALPLALAWGWDDLTGRDAALSLASGLGLGAGIVCFYAAMATGVVSLVAPVTAVTGAVIPATYGIAHGERPGALALVGIVLALIAVAVVSFAPGTGEQESSGSRPLVLALVAGVSFGAFFTLFGEIDEAAGMWPVPLQRVASSLLLGALVVVTRASLRAVRPVAGPVVMVASLEIAATAFILLAVQRGPLSVASVLASLYPVTTVLLAGLVLRERLTRVQVAAVALALVAVVLVTAG